MEKLRKFETEEQYLNEKESLEYPSVSLTQDNGKVWVKNNLIGEFEIYDFDDPPFEFLIGMTWEEFINSNYNSYGFKLKNDRVYLKSNPIIVSMDDSTPIIKTDLIINGYIYASIPV